jgi:hypothetical protein
MEKKYKIGLVFLFFIFGLFLNKTTNASINLVTNGDFSTDDSTGWTVIENGGSGATFSGGVYATSYAWCSISQTIDLVAAGYSEAVLDNEPSIAFSLSTFQRGDHDGEYYLEFKLLASDGVTVVANSLYGSAGSPIYLNPDNVWFDTDYTFSGYGAGARYAYIKIAGRDGSPDWGGQYGPYFDNASISITDSTAPTVSTLSPVDGATDVAVDSNLVITFDEVVDAESGNITLYKATDDSTIETFDVTSDISGSGTTEITINPDSDFDGETEYYVFIDATAFDDSSSNSYAGINASSTWNFTTADIDGSTVSGISPSGQQGVGTESVTLSATTDESATCKYSTSSGTAYGSMTSFSSTNSTSHSTSITGLTNGESYNYYIKCQDGSSNESSEYTASFSIANVSGGGPPPPPLPIGIGQSTVYIQMNQAMDIGKVDLEGINTLAYIYSQIIFSAKLSKTKEWKQFTIDIKKMDLFYNLVEIQSNFINTSLSLALKEQKKFDIDKDGIYDIEINFIDILINRIEFTITAIEENLVESEVINIKEEEKMEIINEKENQKNEQYIFTRDLYLGIKGDDVIKLQKYLNNNGFILDSSGAGSPGKETNYFGQLTQNALIKFQQEKNISPAVGYFGPITKSYIK